MPEERIDLRFAPELKIKDFWEKVPKIAYPAELLAQIGYFNESKEALVQENGKIIVQKIGKDFKGEIFIAYPANKREERLFYEFDRFLREMQMSVMKISEFNNPQDYEIWHKMIIDKEVILFSEIATFFDILRMRALRMALNEFNSSYTRERMIMMERVREESNE